MPIDTEFERNYRLFESLVKQDKIDEAWNVAVSYGRANSNTLIPLGDFIPFDRFYDVVTGLVETLKERR